jgi:hypothetical protein
MAATQVAIATMTMAQVSKPGGDFEIVEREVSKAVQGHVRIKSTGGVRAMIETYPLEKAEEAYARMMSGRMSP